jgi:hypothetical protein
MPELKVRSKAENKNGRNHAECEVVENLGSGIRVRILALRSISRCGVRNAGEMRLEDLE